MSKRVVKILVICLCTTLAIGPSVSLAATTKASSKSAYPSSIETGVTRSKRNGPPKARPYQITAGLAGQSATLLPDGRLLLIGGEDVDGPRTGSAIRDTRSGETVALQVGLHQARAWHSATILPDGRVLVLGGIGADGRVLDSAEIFDPETDSFVLLPAKELTPRAHHTATLLTDGHVLIAGGLSANGRLLGKAELWEPDTQTTTVLAGKLNIARQNHLATLLSDGSVLIEGGIDADANDIDVGSSETYDQVENRFSLTALTSAQTDKTPPYVAASVPADGAINVPVDSRVAFRFSKSVRVETISAQTIRVMGAEGTITAKVVPAEHGRLAFITPYGSLLPGSTYTVAIAGVKEGTNELATTSVTFRTKESKNDSKQSQPNSFAGDADWLPDADNLRGNWKSKYERSDWQDLAPLQAVQGETALAGQVLTLTGQPLANVTLRVGNETTRTDRSGRFLLRSLSAGHQVLVIDGRTASTRGRVYGTFRAGVDITANKTNTLPYTIWMPRLDIAHAVRITSPTTNEVIITNPRIPGLELHLPAGTVVRDLDGQIVTQISITPVPTDRPPFPLPPGFNVPVFASIQPGGARVIPPRARLIYPNYTNERPGARIDFWNYDPEERGWYIYGQGTVNANGTQIIPDPGVAVYEFSGIMISSGGSPPLGWPELGDNDEDGDPLDLSTGLFVYDRTDLVLTDVLPISLTRTYRPGDNASRAFGIGSTHPYEMFLWSVTNYTAADLILPDGARVHYVRISPGTSYTDAIYEHTTTPTVFYKSRLSWNGTGFDLKLKDGTTYVFPAESGLKYIRDRYGNQTTITRSSGTTGNITEVTSPNGRWVQFTYDTSNRITQAKDHTGRTVNYTYDAGGRLWKVTDPNGGVTEYTYDGSNRMLTIKDARGIVYLTNQYDANGRVIRQTQADSSTFQFAYTLDGNGKVTQTDVTDPHGNVRRVTFNSSGYTLTDTSAFGTPEQQTVTITRESGTNRPLNVIDSLNRKTAYGYDSMANLTSITVLADTPQTVTTSFTYEPTYNQVTSVTDPLSHTTSYAYDSKGNVTSINDPLNHQTRLAYNPRGQLISMTNPLEHTTQWSYNVGDLLSVTNPLGNTTSRFVDGLGRPVSTSDALGRISRYTYNALNQITEATDPRGGITSFSYDQNGNLLTVTDARNSVTGYTYDAMDRVVTRRDPLLRDESYQYDAKGNVIQVTDRKSQITDFTYDALDRLTLVTYADNSTTSYLYDAGNRLLQAVDSLSGTIAFTYDNLDRLLSETTPQGTVSYTYDSGGRLASMTVTGQPTVNYSYDAADRLTGITQGQSSVAYTYDSADRRTSLTLPNGLVGEYGYDVGSNLTSITYRQGANVLGSLTYQYDATRQRTKVGGSFAGTNLPQTLTSATYDAANRMTQRGTTAFSYDNNGNLLSDGSNSYGWDARDQLSAISGGTAAGFQYDAFARRTSKTINSQSTQYLYDGADVVQELAGGVPTANMLNGPGVDERHTCNCNGGSSTLLTDGLGSALALTDSSGAVQTLYTYDAFGNTTSTGAPSSNTSQYTGRENDSSGLYYYRARYYSPTLQRFISEDPIGFAGGDVNLYAYVGNNPTSFSDPLGTNPFIAGAGAACLEGALINVGMDALFDTLAGRKITLSGIGRSALMGCATGLLFFGLGRALQAFRRGMRGVPGRAPDAAQRVCFVAGTLIQTTEGDKRIEDVRKGDLVLSFDPERANAGSLKPQAQLVTQTFARTASAVLDIHIGNATITATPEHPFWVVKQGWTAAGELRRGSALLTKDGTVVHVDTIERREGKFKVYNFEVGDAHTYYVSALGVLVHNQCGPERPIYRSGDTSPSGLQHGKDVSYRDSLSEPFPQGPKGPVFNKSEYIITDANKLPPGSVVYDGGTGGHPAGHVTVNAPVDAIKQASKRKKFPKF
ncbi:MAG TPA: RHS repeat-associated core domain-containing protein [Pyrinomonadaceae bacterium]|nr:RHS repeat-associated core domain-containing protein [Pyrinomonadaceae bacterium]